MSGHGWVTPNPDGTKARCGGPAICFECARERGTVPARIGARAVAAAAALKPLGLTLVVSPDEFVITDKPDDLGGETSIHYPTIEQVEAFIADRRRFTATVRPKPIEQRRPRVSDLVHYVSHGSPVRADGTQAYTSQCRAAMITEVTEVEVNEHNPAGDGIFRQTVGLMVASPTGQFFNRGVLFHDVSDSLAGGTWHWADHA